MNVTLNPSVRLKPYRNKECTGDILGNVDLDLQLNILQAELEARTCRIPSIRCNHFTNSSAQFLTFFPPNGKSYRLFFSLL